METFTITGRIGEGAYGVVLSGIEKETGRHIALKKVLIKRIEDGIPVSIIREIKSLQELSHPNVSNQINEKVLQGLSFFVFLMINFFSFSRLLNCSMLFLQAWILSWSWTTCLQEFGNYSKTLKDP